MPTNSPVSPTPSGYRLLTDDQLAQIHHAALEILEQTGSRVFNAEARDLLLGAGCTISDSDLVRIPPTLIEKALESAPSKIVLHDRNGVPAVHLEDHRTYYGTGSDLPFTRDLESGERRASVLEDIGQAARLADALPNLDFVMSMAQASDVDPQTSDRKAFLAMVENTTKPIIFTVWDEQGLADIIAMAEAVAGGAEQLAAKPFLLAYLEPTSPLQHLDEVMRKLFMMADKGLPFVYAPGPIEGASAPVTAAGSLAMAVAEGLTGLAIAQIRRPGTPFLFGSGSGPLDMKTMVATYASPEFMRHCMGVAEMAHYYYSLPAWGFSGCADAKEPDAQAGAESALWILWTELSGANLVHDIGYIESGLTCSLEMMVICDEIIGAVRRLVSPFDTSAESFALEAIDQVGPGGDFLASKHTLDHYKQCWYPTVFDRRSHQAWSAAGSPSASQAARDRARELLASHQPEKLPPALVDTLRQLIDERENP
jgi:trimethylamine--corrinoid protein Co-methyltransferase